MAPTAEPAGKKIHSCISITTFQTTGREKADGMEPPSTKESMPGLFWMRKMHVRCWPRALHSTGRIFSVVRQLDLCSRTQSTIAKFFWSRWMLLFNRDQSLRAWWQVVAHFYFSLRCESHLNCLSDTRHRVNFSWQPAFFFHKVIKLCAWVMQRWHVFRLIRIRSGFTPVKIHPKGLQVHRCTQSFKYFWVSLSIYIYISTINTSICSQSCVWTSARDGSLAENFQAWYRRKTTHPSSRNSAAAVAVLSNLHLYHFDGKFHPFALQLPKLSSKNITGIV